MSKESPISDGNPSRIYFLSLAYSFLCIGLSVGVIGPTLLNIKVQNNSRISDISYIFLVRNIGSLFGSIIASNIVSKHIEYGKSLLCLSVFIMGTMAAAIPFIYNIFLLIFTQLIFGLAMGMIDNLAQILLLKDSNKHTVGPYLHALHFTFGKV